MQPVNSTPLTHRCRVVTAALLVLATLLLSGCASGPGSNYRGSQSISEARQAAEELAMRGDHAGAARQYLEISNNSEGPGRNRYLILAARELYLSNDIPSAERLLSQVGMSVGDINLSLWATVSAEVKLAADQPQQALAVLDKIPASDPDANSPRVLLLQAKALFQMGQAEAGVKKLMQRDTTLRSAKDKAANQRNMYIGLQTAGESIPGNPQSSDPIVNGWLVLGTITWQQRNDVGAMRSALNDWRNAYPEHPAASSLVPQLLSELGAMLNYPNRVALLLPLGGRQSTTAEAIRDGFLAAHFAQSQLPEQPEVMIYDSSLDAVAAYEKALRDGADFVVGPLLKDNVANIALYPEKVTTLALNNIADDNFRQNNFYQFALSPEDEARQVARRAVAEGRLYAIALIPDTEWGRRVLESFTDELRMYGGDMLDQDTYTPDSPDYSADIKRLLLLTQSEARHTKINQLVGTSTGYEPRVREDADFIFLVANHRDGGILKPQLRFYYAGGLSTFATSAIYQPGGSADNDLNGITFPDSPWVLGKMAAPDIDAVMLNYWGSAAQRRQRFYAMGHDAYRLLPLLNQAEQPITTTVNGLSGRLSITLDGTVERTLSWAEIRNGSPYPLAETPQLIPDNPEAALLP